MSAIAPGTNTRPLLEAARLARGVWPRLTLAAAAGALSIGTAVALTATSAWLLSRAAQHPPVLTLMVAIVAVRTFGLARGVLRYTERLVAHDAAFRILAQTRVRVFAALERLAPAGIGDYRFGELLGRLVDDVDAIQDVYLRVAVPVAAGSLVGVTAVVGLGWAAPGAGAALAIGLVIAGGLVPAWTARAGARAGAADAAVRSDLAAATRDAVAGAPDLLALGADSGQLALVAHLDRQLERAARADARAAGVSALLTALTTGGTMLACLILGILAVRSGRLPGVMLATVVLTPLAAFEAVAAFPGAAQQLGRLRASTARVMEVLSRPAPTHEPACPVRPPVPPVQVSVLGLTATWPGARRPALRDIDLDLPVGRRVAVVGPSGSGKSTLVAVLLGLLPPQRGSVQVGGCALRDLADEDVRRLVGSCGQDAHVFDASIADNVRIGRVDATEDQLREALQGAGLLDWVDGLPDGLDTHVGEAGGRLSGGQRQRLALARELVADRSVVLLDEPTEHLEESLATDLTADLLRAVGGRTTVLVTHRLLGLDAVDEIVVLTAGRVVQRGTHVELVAEWGWYRDAWLAQQ